MNEKMKELLIRAAYGDVTPVERIKVTLILIKKSNAKRFYDSYKSTSVKVKSLRKGNLPSDVIEKLDAMVTEKTGRKEKGTLLQYPGFVAAFSILLIALFTFTFLKKNTNYYGKYNEKTVENATEETLASLKMVASIFAQTQKIVVENVLVNKVSKPINNGLNQVEKIIK